MVSGFGTDLSNFKPQSEERELLSSLTHLLNLSALTSVEGHFSAHLSKHFSMFVAQDLSRQQ